VDYNRQGEDNPHNSNAHAAVSRGACRAAVAAIIQQYQRRPNGVLCKGRRWQRNWKVIREL